MGVRKMLKLKRINNKTLVMSLKETILDYLKQRDLFHETDEVLIEELLYNIKLSKLAKKDIDSQGIQVNITVDPNKNPYWVKNQAVNIYQESLNRIQSLYRQLSLSPNERQKLKIELSNKKDEFDEVFD